MRSISGSVGRGGTNAKADVVTVQDLLNKVPQADGGPPVPLKVDGLAWDKTIAAIRRFQSVSLGHKWPDGKVDPMGKTLARLNEFDEPAPARVRTHYIHVVPGHKPVVAQPSVMTCWAAVYTAMRSWREKKTFDIAEALEKPGKTYVERFKQGLSLPPSAMREFWTRGGLAVRGMAIFPVHIWYDLLTQHGLLAVGTAAGLPPVAGLHLRVMEGMSCSDEPGDRYLFIDSAWGGSKYAERRFDFEAKFHNAISYAGGTHWQIAHYR